MKVLKPLALNINSTESSQKINKMGSTCYAEALHHIRDLVIFYAVTV
jgi:hypothetical protein